MTSNQERELAACASVKFVRDGTIVGLGSGSTAAYAIRYLGERVRAGMKIRGIATSVQTHNLAVSLGIPLTTLDEVRRIDVTIDGADEFDPELRLIKGGGARINDQVVMRFDHVYEVDPSLMTEHTPQQDIPAWDTLRIVESRWEHLAWMHDHFADSVVSGEELLKEIEAEG